MSQKYLYLMLNCLAVVGPLLLSFDKKVAYYKTWKLLMPSIVISAIPFIIWDIAFVELNVWSFNPNYISGLNLFGLPIEEVLFFFTIPFATVFIYECLKYWFPIKSNPKYLILLATVILAMSVVFTFLYAGKWYTFITAITLSVVLIVHFIIFNKAIIGRIMLAQLIIWALPFAVINGILTAKPVVIYNNLENLNFRIGSIPVEDFFYGFLLFLLNISLFELLRQIKSTRNEINKSNS